MQAQLLTNSTIMELPSPCHFHGLLLCPSPSLKLQLVFRIHVGQEDWCTMTLIPSVVLPSSRFEDVLDPSFIVVDWVVASMAFGLGALLLIVEQSKCI